MERIKLPLFNWFVCTQEGRPVSNFYTGSYGTDGETGCIGTRTFNYRIFTEKKTIIDENTENEEKKAEKTIEIFVAESYIIEAFADGGGKTNFLREEFERTEEGLSAIADWLTKNATKEGF